LLFSSALPFLRGPALLAGWMVQVLDSVQRDVAASTPADPVAQTEGAMDLLSNLVMVLAYRASPHERPATLDLRHPVFARTRATLASPSPTVTRSAAALPTHAPYRWSSARDTLTPFMRERLEGLSLRAVQQPWPLALPGAETSGRLKGLLQDTRSTPPQWQAVVRGHVYRVRLVGDSVQVTDAAGTASGPWRAAAGIWTCACACAVARPTPRRRPPAPKRVANNWSRIYVNTPNAAKPRSVLSAWRAA
jgi:hypothetical protein